MGRALAAGTHIWRPTRQLTELSTQLGPVARTLHDKFNCEVDLVSQAGSLMRPLRPWL